MKLAARKAMLIALVSAIRLRRAFSTGGGEYSFIANLFFGNAPQKRALVSYSVSSFAAPATGKMRSSDIDLRIIIKELNERGYVVDLADARSTVQPRKDYDLVFGMGLPFRAATSRHTEKCKRIMYLTEAHPTTSSKNERKRCESYWVRNGARPPLSRSDAIFKSEDFNNVDSVIALGDSERAQDITQLLSNRSKVVAILPSTGEDSSSETTFDPQLKSNNSFVQVGTGGAIHKGVDIITEAARREKDIDLHIFGHLGLERLLITTSLNTTVYGYVDMSSNVALETLTRCRFTILHSASEASPTGVLLAMLHGCIPVLSKNCGVNLAYSEFAYFLESDDPRQVATKLKALSKTDNDTLEQRSRMARSFAQSRCTEVFKADVQKIFCELGI